MNKLTPILIEIGLAAILGLTAISCTENIFGFTPKDEELDNLEKANELMREEQYTEARELLEEVLAVDEFWSDALYLHSKAVRYETEIPLGEIFYEMENVGEAGDGSLPVFSRNPDLTQKELEDDWDKKTKLLRSNIIIRKNLKKIFDGLTHGSFTSIDIALDYTIALTMYGFLFWRDINGDTTINADDEIDFNISEDGLLEGLGNLFDQIGPAGINNLIGGSTALLSDAADVLLGFVAAGDTSNEAIDSDAIDSLVTEVNSNLTMFYVNVDPNESDPTINPGYGDNDGDWIDVNGNGVQDPTIFSASGIIRLKNLRSSGSINFSAYLWRGPDDLPIDPNVAVNSGGPPYGEWIGGDWGVDDELLDNFDNDGDKKFDEDAFDF